ncbi:unnamed protein product [Brassicogethes aeneus]|uniref:Uncharacterized protein n=1 Tax=Brassicogethes aeneus TaxID=1431903 RepID=A0A9P0AR68_BRAAE|nr:unnamed protein product [Brassicogethes aeneus]
MSKNTTIKELDNRMAAMELQFKRDLESLKEKLTENPAENSENRISAFQTFEAKTLNQLSQLKNDILSIKEEMEAESNKNSFLVHGIPENKDEDLIESLTNIFDQKLNMKINKFHFIRKISISMFKFIVLCVLCAAVAKPGTLPPNLYSSTIAENPIVSIPLSAEAKIEALSISAIPVKLLSNNSSPLLTESKLCTSEPLLATETFGSSPILTGTPIISTDVPQIVKVW